ncbi:MAG TPA: transcriptional repressor LexA, partial [Mycobacteriales bacterium]|nr:transcriptional repressor LexA [Mycobacteriales bacterium]
MANDGKRTRSGTTARSNVRELPDAAPDATGLTPRQQRILNVLRDSIEQRGYPPSIREIGDIVGLASSSSVAHQLRVLEQKGFIKRDPNRPRALEVFLPELMAARRSLSAADDSGFDETGIGDAAPPAAYVPLLGRIAAGGPILAEENLEEVFPLPKTLVGEGNLFLLEVSGDSMIDAAICNGDYVVVRQAQTAENGEIVAAMIDGEATVKT